MTRSGRVLGAALLACLAGLAFTGYRYWRYAGEHLRDTPKVPACVVLAKLLRKPEVVSGTEPHDDVNGETVYLRPNEDKVVRCAASVSHDLARRLTTAFAESEPEPRALELLKVMREVPPGAEHDKVAHMAYRFADGAMQALPPLPETKAAAEELDLLHACRFATRRRCPTRPGVPASVWLVGIPSALGLLMVLSVPVRSLVARLSDRIRSRRKTTPSRTAGRAAAGDENGAEPRKTRKRKAAEAPAQPKAAASDTGARDDD